MKKHLVLLLLTVVTSCAGHSRSRNTVYGCEGAKVDLSCEHGKVINIIRANYGRISSNICSENGQNSDNWSTRCIQPTTLRHVTSACGKRVSSCSIHVTSSLFGDACPNTPKYLELVYTCQDREQVSETPDLPPWLLSLDAISNSIMMKTTTTSTTTREATTTTTTTTAEDIDDVEEIIVIETNEIPESAPEETSYKVRQPSTKFLRYLHQMKQRNEENNRISLMLNNPREDKQIEVTESDQDNVTAAIVIAVIATLLLFAAIVLAFCCRNKGSKSQHQEIDAESTSSSYLSSYSTPPPTKSSNSPSTIILGKDGKLYQPVFISSNFLPQQNYIPYSNKSHQNGNRDLYEYAEIASNYQQHFLKLQNKI